MSQGGPGAGAGAAVAGLGGGRLPLLPMLLPVLLMVLQDRGGGSGASTRLRRL